MTIRTKYDFELLSKYCNENGVILMEDYSKTYLGGKANVKCKCIYKNCENEFEKKFENLIKTGSYCLSCIKIMTNERRKQFCLEKYGCENVTQNNLIREKQKNAILQKYGVEYSFQSESVKNKIKAICLEKYGVENPSQNKNIKNKSKKTCLEKYDVEYTSQIKENRDKFKATCLEKYGVENPSQNEEIKNKKLVTSLKNWGVKYPSQNEEIKNKKIETCLQNWGVEYPMQNNIIMSKNVKQNYKKKEYILPSNKIIEIQGYENFALDELIINEKIEESNIVTGVKNVPTIWYNDDNGKKHRHYVDIFITSQNRCIEVKSTWTAEKNKHNIFLKQKAAKELGYKYEIWCYNNKKEKIFCYH
jgi:hypothetical protein